MVRHDYRFTSLAVSGCLLFLLVACSPFGSADSGPTPTPSTSGRTATPTTGGATSTPTTAPMPATPTACPTAFTARAAVFAPLVLGLHQNIVYVFNQFAAPGYSGSGEIKRYDASTSKKVIIVNTPKSLIGDAQISPDGQWILFTTAVSSSSAVALQLVRMDGQGLQTLYCSYTEQFGLGSIDWSPDQKTVAFNDGNKVDLLDLATGHLQVVLVEPSAGIWAFPATWLDDTHIYMPSFVPYSDVPPQSLYALDTAKGADQQVSDLIKVFDYSGSCLSFDSSVDNAKLFVSTCHATHGPGVSPTQQGPSTIISEPALGGPQTTVSTNPTLAITTVRVISRTTMLLLIQNLTGDTSHNGLWKMNLDGTGLTHLTTAGTGQMSSLNGTSQFPWSNISRDGSMYALEIHSNNGTTQALLIGSLGGTSPSTFATVSHTVGGVAIVGWTTM
jgi:dipeptidyl aminopeptidase/acylaminoacyl peptidase